MMISTLEEIVVINEHRFTALGAHVDKVSLRKVAQQQERSQLADLAARMAQLSNGIAALHQCALTPLCWFINIITASCP